MCTQKKRKEHMPEDRIRLSVHSLKESYISAALGRTMPGLSPEEKLLLFFAVHYRENEPEDGRGRIYTGAVHIDEKAGQSRSGFPYMKRLLGVYTDTILDFLKDFRLKKRKDIYITANCMKTTKTRSRKNLFCLNNIVIDIDACGKKKTGERTAADLEQYLMFILGDAGLPIPNTSVQTGRGLQLWWNIAQLPASASEAYGRAAEYFCGKIEELIDSVPAFAGLFTVDRRASLNTAGLFRMPGSCNTKTGRCGTYEIRHARQLDIFELPCVSGTPGRKAAGSFRKNACTFTDTDKYLCKALKREKGLTGVIEARIRNGVEAGGEMRDLFLFCLASSYSSCLDEDSIREKLKKMNSRFLVPMDEGEMFSYMSSVFKKKYTVRDDTIAKMLCLTKEEQELSGIHVYDTAAGQEEKAGKKEARNEKKDSLIKKAVRLYRKGESLRSIAEKTGVPASTVREYIRKRGITRRDPVKARDAGIIKLLSAGTSVAETARRTGTARNTVKKVRGIYAALISMLAEKRERGGRNVQTWEQNPAEAGVTAGRRPLYGKERKDTGRGGKERLRTGQESRKTAGVVKLCGNPL